MPGRRLCLLLVLCGAVAGCGRRGRARHDAGVAGQVAAEAPSPESTCDLGRGNVPVATPESMSAPRVEPRIVIVDHGREPRQVLNRATGQTVSQRWTLTMRKKTRERGTLDSGDWMTWPAVITTLASEPASQTATQLMILSVEVGDHASYGPRYRPLPDGSPPTEVEGRRYAEVMREMLAPQVKRTFILVNGGGDPTISMVSMSPGEFNIENLLTPAFTPLPAEPVGPGARWQIHFVRGPATYESAIRFEGMRDQAAVLKVLTRGHLPATRIRPRGELMDIETNTTAEETWFVDPGLSLTAFQLQRDDRMVGKFCDGTKLVTMDMASTTSIDFQRID